MVVEKRRPLNRRRILEAAMRYVDREGLEALSMRKLGTELGVEAMSLYNHVPNKDALLDGMVEVMLSGLAVPPPGEDWEERVREAYRVFRRMAHEHPNIFPLLVTRPPETMYGAWLVEEFLETLRGAGFDAETGLHAYRVISSYAAGYAMAEIRDFALQPDASRSDNADLPAEEFPRLAELSPKLKDTVLDAEFEFGLDLILGGLKALL